MTSPSVDPYVTCPKKGHMIRRSICLKRQADPTFHCPVKCKERKKK